MTKFIKTTLNSGVIGIAVGFMVALFFSVAFNANYLEPSSPMFNNQFHSPLTATVVAAILWMLMGIVFGIASQIFTVERWSITRQTLTHFIVVFVLFTPLAIIAGWFPLDVLWLVYYTIIFVVIYLVMWFISMLDARQQIMSANQSLKDSREH